MEGGFVAEGPLVLVVQMPKVPSPYPAPIRWARVVLSASHPMLHQASGGRARAPEAQSELVIGHEIIGQVAEVGKAVTRVAPGDYAVFTVRRGCGKCLPCQMR